MRVVFPSPLPLLPKGVQSGGGGGRHRGKERKRTWGGRGQERDGTETVRQGASPLSLSSPGGQWGASVPSSGRVSDDPQEAKEEKNRPHAWDARSLRSDLQGTQLTLLSGFRCLAFAVFSWFKFISSCQQRCISLLEICFQNFMRLSHYCLKQYIQLVLRKYVFVVVFLHVIFLHVESNKYFLCYIKFSHLLTSCIGLLNFLQTDHTDFHWILINQTGVSFLKNI